MKTQSRPRWPGSVAGTTLAIALVVSTLVTGAVDSVSARKHSSAKLVQGFSNPTPVTIRDNAAGVTDQSTIFVSGFETEIADVDVTLHNLSHGLVGDVDALLVGPGGQSAFLISDVGSSANNVTLTLDDQAANQVSSSAAMATGTFQPTNFSSGDSFFPPAPQNPPTGSELGVFNSTDANGNWSLFLLDDNPSGTGGTLAGGWSLRIVSANGVPNASPETFSATAGKTLREDSGVLTNDGDPDNDSLTAILAGAPSKGKLDLQPDGSFTYRANKKAKGKDSFTYLAKDPGGLSDLETVNITIKKAKKKGKR